MLIKKGKRRIQVLLFASVLGLVFVSCTKKKKIIPNTIYDYAIAKIKTLDPIFGTDAYSSRAMGLSYETLYSYEYLVRPYQLKPFLAEAMPSWSANKKVLTIRIRKGILFQDDPCFEKTHGKGRELVAKDFIYSWKRLADPHLVSPMWWIFEGKIKGLDKWREKMSKLKKTDYMQAVSGLKATDRYTLKIELNKPSYLFTYFLAMLSTAPVAQEAVKYYGPDFMRHPVGTGPYVFMEKESDLGSKLIWKRNPIYRNDFYPKKGTAQDRKQSLLKDAGKRIPFADRIVRTVMIESQPMWLNFMQGKLDRLSIPKDNFNQAVTPSKELTPELKKKGLRLVTAPSLDLTYTGFNYLDPVLGGKKGKYLRQAMSLAYNMKKVSELFYNGRIMEAQGPLPPGLEGYDPNFKNPYRVFDLQKAKALLKKAGHPNGKGLPVLRLATLASSTSRQMADFFVQSMRAIGIKVKVESYTWPQFTTAINQRKLQIYGMAWGADYPDPENFLQLFYGPNRAPGPNGFNYQNPKYDQLYQKMIALPPGSSKRKKIIHQMVSILVEDCPVIFGGHRLLFALVWPWLKNYKPHDLEMGPLKYYRLDLDLKKKFFK